MPTLAPLLDLAQSALVLGLFANPLMLWGLGAASLPIVIHLLNRRRFREMRWAASRFLLAAIRKNQRRIRVEQWLLLAVRTLLVILVVLAMAKPFLESLGAVPLLPGQRTHWVIVLDGSASMDYATAETTRFDQAKSLADGLVKSARRGDAFSVVLMADPPRVVIGAPAFNRDVVRKELGEVTLPHGGTNLRASFEKIDEVLAASDIPRKEVVFLTDMQAASWARAQGPGDEGLTRALARIGARKPRSWVIDLGAPGAENVAITDLALNAPVVTQNQPVVVRANVRNFGRKPVQNLRVRLLSDGQLGPDQTVTLEPGEEQPIALSHEFVRPGDHLLEVQVDDDPLKLDNHRWLAVPVRDAVKVLLVDGDPKSDPFKSETDFLAAALSPEPEPNGPPAAIRVEVVAESQLTGRELAPYDAVIVCNVARFTEADRAALDAYLKQGGGVVFFGGDQVAADNYNQLLFANGKGILPAEIGPPVGEPKRQDRPFEFDPLGFKHPIVSAFAGEPAGVTASLTNVKTARFHRLKIPKDSNTKVALAFSNGDPAVVEAPRRRGRVILVATSADAAWTSWPLHQSYPPVMEQIVMLAASGRAAERNVLVGQALRQSFPPSGLGATATVRRPTGPPATTRLEADGDVAQLRYEATDLSGTYRVQVGPPLSSDVLFAANVEPAESDPAKLDEAGLRRALPGWDFVYDNNLRPFRENGAAVGQRGEVHRPLLWGVLTLLLFESFLAWKFGHYTGRA